MSSDSKVETLEILKKDPLPWKRHCETFSAE